MYKNVQRSFYVKKLYFNQLFPRHSTSAEPKVATCFGGSRMKAWQIEKFGDVNDVCLSSVRVPLILKPSEVLIKVSAASVNPLDTAMIGGYGNHVFEVMRAINRVQLGGSDLTDLDIPLTVGRDFAGEVVGVGHSVSNVKVKDKVWGVVSPQRQGSHAEYTVTESCNVCCRPDSVSDVQAASIPYVALTSWSAAVISGGMTPNQCYGAKVLVIGASGGIGTFLTQLLSTWGAEVVGVCNNESFELALSCGVSEVHDYKDSQTQDELTSHPRFDLIINAGGNNDIKWAKGLKQWQNASYVTLTSPLLRNTDQSGICTGFLKSAYEILQMNAETLVDGRFYKWAYFMPNHNALQEITKLVSQNKIRSVIDKVFPMENAKAAYSHVVEGPARGKTVIDINLEFI